MRDMVQNHMMQLLTLVAMEPPTNFGANAVRDEKVKVLKAVPPLAEAEIVWRGIPSQLLRAASVRESPYLGHRGGRLKFAEMPDFAEGAARWRGHLRR